MDMATRLAIVYFCIGASAHFTISFQTIPITHTYNLRQPFHKDDIMASLLYAYQYNNLQTVKSDLQQTDGAIITNKTQCLFTQADVKALLLKRISSGGQSQKGRDENIDK